MLSGWGTTRDFGGEGRGVEEEDGMEIDVICFFYIRMMSML